MIPEDATSGSKNGGPKATSGKGSPTNVNDSDLWRKFCNGDEYAFAVIYKSHVQSLINFGYQLGKDKELAKDIIQDLFIRLRTSGKATPIKSIRSYLFKCFYSDWIKRTKKKALYEPISNDFGITLSFEDTEIAKQIGEDKLAYLKSSIGKLTSIQRRGIMLFFFEGLSYEEVAEAMGLKNAKSARKLIYRALERLKPSDAVMKVLYSFLL